MMRHLLLAGAAALALPLAGCGKKEASTETAAAPAAVVAEDTAAATPAEAPTVDPAAIEALNKMTAYLGTLQSFEITTQSSLDDVLESGQKIQYEGGATYRVTRPNSFFIEMHTDRRLRQFFYDGKTLIMFSPRMKMYTKIDAPATILETLEKAEQDYDINLPLVDIFRWGQEPEDASKLTSAIHIGYAKIGEANTDQYAFRQDGVDWQIWIEKGEKPLPRKLVITTLADPTQPQFIAHIDWKTDAKLDPRTFVFQPAADAHEVAIVKVAEN